MGIGRANDHVAKNSVSCERVDEDGGLRVRRAMIGERERERLYGARLSYALRISPEITKAAQESNVGF